MDALIFRVYNFAGVVADFGPFEDKEQAVAFLQERGWKRESKHRFRLTRQPHRADLEGRFLWDWNRLTPSKLPSKEE